MHFRRVIWLTRAECAAALERIYFNFRISGKLHKCRRRLFRIRRIFHFKNEPSAPSAAGTVVRGAFCVVERITKWRYTYYDKPELGEVLSMKIEYEQATIADAELMIGVYLCKVIL